MSEETMGRRPSWLQVLGIALFAVVTSVAISVWLIKLYVFPTAFTPTVLNATETRVLNAKLEGFETGKRPSSETVENRGGAVLMPEPYSETGANREISLTERELNALLAKNTDLAQKLAIDLSDGLLSAKLLVPVDPDFPILGGRTIRVRAGLEMAYRHGRPVMVLRGISIMGVPVPSAWLGGLKNVDLVDKFGDQAGFWRGFAEGVDSLEVEEGKLKLQLRE